MYLNNNPIRIKSQASKANIARYFLATASKSERRLLNFLIWFAQRFGNFNPSQELLASRVGITRQYCNYLLHKLKQLGFLTSVYRHRHTCVYRIASFFFIPSIRKELTPMLSNLAMITLMTLFMGAQLQSSEKQLQREKLTPFKTKTKNLKRDSMTYTSKSTQKSDSSHPLSKLWVKHPVTQQDIPLPLNPKLFPIKGIDLTVWALIKLSIFPNVAIEHAKKALQTIDIKQLDDPYRWLFRNCMAYCIREGIELDDDQVNELMLKHKVPFDAPMIKVKRYHHAPVDLVVKPVSSQAFGSLYKALGADIALRQAETESVEQIKKDAWLKMFPVPDRMRDNEGDHHVLKKEKQ